MLNVSLCTSATWTDLCMLLNVRVEWKQSVETARMAKVELVRRKGNLPNNKTVRDSEQDKENKG